MGVFRLKQMHVAYFVFLAQFLLENDEGTGGLYTHIHIFRSCNHKDTISTGSR